MNAKSINKNVMANSSSKFSSNLQIIECFEEANEETPT
jgi:hypothetical protein